jgi:lysophospholipase L1-like esterase
MTLNDRTQRIHEGLRDLLTTNIGWGLAHNVKFFIDRMALHPRAFSGVALGDSWFDYDFTAMFLDGGGHDLIDHLDHSGLLNVFRLSVAGDTLEHMVNGRQMDNTIHAINVIDPDFMMISGGGNDLAGSDGVRLERFLTPGGLSRAAAFVMIGGAFRKSYQTLIDEVRKVASGLPIVVHGYAYAVPDGRGVTHPLRDHPMAGPWLEPAFDRRGIPADQRQAVVAELIDLFNAMLRELAAENPGVHYIDLRPVLRPTPNDWANELHPTSAGFKKVADVFERTILALMPPKAAVSSTPALAPVSAP